METDCPVKSTSGQEGNLAWGPLLHCPVLSESSLLGTISGNSLSQAIRDCDNVPWYQACPDRWTTVLSSPTWFIVAWCTRLHGLMTMTDSPVCMKGIFPPIYFWKGSHLVTNTTEPTHYPHTLQFLRFDQSQLKILKNDIFTKQVQSFFLSLRLIQKSIPASYISFAFYFVV